MLNGNSKSETTFASNEPKPQMSSKSQHVLLFCINFVGPIMASVQRLLGRATTEKGGNMLRRYKQTKLTDCPQGLTAL